MRLDTKNATSCTLYHFMLHRFFVQQRQTRNRFTGEEARWEGVHPRIFWSAFDRWQCLFQQCHASILETGRLRFCFWPSPNAVIRGRESSTSIISHRPRTTKHMLVSLQWTPRRRLQYIGLIGRCCLVRLEFWSSSLDTIVNL